VWGWLHLGIDLHVVIMYTESQLVLSCVLNPCASAVERGARWGGFGWVILCNLVVCSCMNDSIRGLRAATAPAMAMPVVLAGPAAVGEDGRIRPARMRQGAAFCRNADAAALVARLAARARRRPCRPAPAAGAPSRPRPSGPWSSFRGTTTSARRQLFCLV
jgi:hypothetical protein